MEKGGNGFGFGACVWRDHSTLRSADWRGRAFCRARVSGQSLSHDSGSMSPVENTSQGSDRHFVFPRHDRRICAFVQDARELDMTSLLATFSKRSLGKPSGLSRPNFYLDLTNHRRVGGDGRLEVQFQGFAQIFEILLCSVCPWLAIIHPRGIVRSLPNFPHARSLRSSAVHSTILPQEAFNAKVSAGEGEADWKRGRKARFSFLIPFWRLGLGFLRVALYLPATDDEAAGTFKPPF